MERSGKRFFKGRSDRMGKSAMLLNHKKIGLHLMISLPGRS
jgi:hypothetical protein